MALAGRGALVRSPLSCGVLDQSVEKALSTKFCLIFRYILSTREESSKKKHFLGNEDEGQ